VLEAEPVTPYALGTPQPKSTSASGHCSRPRRSSQTQPPVPARKSKPYTIA